MTQIPLRKIRAEIPETAIPERNRRKIPGETAVRKQIPHQREMMIHRNRRTADRIPETPVGAQETEARKTPGAANRQSLAEEVHQNPEAAAAAIPEGAHLPAAAAAVIPEAVQEVPDTAEAPEFPAAVPLQLQAEAARQAAVPDL